MKTRKKLSYVSKLLIAMGVYAVIFAALAAFGLSKLWNYMDAYEHSQYKNTIDSYIQQLDTAHLQSYADDLIASIDPDVQSEETCRQVIADAVSGGVSYARRLSECTDDKTVYMLMSGGKTIGKVVLTAQEKDAYGFATWQITEESFDFSFLLGEGAAVTVPQDYRVYANGILLGEDAITKRDIPYELIKDFYKDYTLPYMVTYEVAPILGDLQITITDASGNTVTQEDAKNEALVLNNCTDTEIAALDTISGDYLNSYIRFSSNAGGALQENYQNILSYIVPGSALADRMYDALNGLKWVNNQQAQILSSTANHRIRLSEGLYLYDFTCEVKISHSGNTATTTENVRLILKETENGLKVERMINY